jgi:hypothetical protein
MLTNLGWFQGEVLDVTIRRMARVEMADHVQMFELFTIIKEVAMVDKPEGAKKVDDCISLWTKMLLADATHDDTIAANVQSMQDAGIQHIGGIQEGLDRIYGLKKQTEEKRRHNLMSRIAKRMLNRVQSTALERWSENACELARQRAVLDRILKRMLNGKMSAGAYGIDRMDAACQCACARARVVVLSAGDCTWQRTSNGVLTWQRRGSWRLK